MALRSFSLGFDNLDHFVTLAPNTDTGGGVVAEEGHEEGEEEGGEKDDKKFTQADLDRILQERLSRSNREAKKKEQEFKALQQRLAELEEQLKKPAGGQSSSGSGESGPDIKTLQGQLELQHQRHERTVQELQQKLAETEKRAAAAEQRQRQVERDTELQQALVAANCIDLVAGQRYFAPQIEWDEVDNKWMFRTRSGNLVSISDGVQEELPKYLRQSQMPTGGSGVAGGGSGRKTQVQRQLAEAEEKLAKIKAEIAKNGPETGLVAQLYQQGQIVKRLQAEAKK